MNKIRRKAATTTSSSRVSRRRSKKEEERSSSRVGRRRLLVVLLSLAAFSLLHCHIKLLKQQEESNNNNNNELHSSWMTTINEFLDAPKGTKNITPNEKEKVSMRGPIRKWAYAFLIGGCSSQKPEYHGFLFNVLVAAQRLQDLGSTADVVLMIQMSATTNESKLPPNEEKMLKDIGIKFKYLPKFSSEVHEVFYALVMEKFRILELTEYSRVLFLDGDVMPLCSMDYLFDLSEPEKGDPILKENVILSWKREASNAGFFMLKPSLADYTRLQQVIHAHEVEAVSLPYPHWDEVQGWGHKIEAPDYWRSAKGINGTNWTWHAAFADQGLLYHWTKYEKRSVSIIIYDDVENWAASKNGTIVLEKTLEKGLLTRYTCNHRKTIQFGKILQHSPYVDFMHFVGKSKPWEKEKMMSQRLAAPISSYTPLLFEGARHDDNNIPPQSKEEGSKVWHQTLQKVSAIHNVTLDFGFTMMDTKRPSMGRASTHKQVIQHLRAKNQTAWSHYASS